MPGRLGEPTLHQDTDQVATEGWEGGRTDSAAFLRLNASSLSTRCANMCSMRWDNLLAEAEDGKTLPGYRDPAVIRRFDAPRP